MFGMQQVYKPILWDKTFFCRHECSHDVNMSNLQEKYNHNFPSSMSLTLHVVPDHCSQRGLTVHLLPEQT